MKAKVSTSDGDIIIESKTGEIVPQKLKADPSEHFEDVNGGGDMVLSEKDMAKIREHNKKSEKSKKEKAPKEEKVKKEKEPEKLIFTDLFGKQTFVKEKKEQQQVEPDPEKLTIREVNLTPLHLACGDDDLRPNMKLIEIKNNIASATNGHILVKIDLSLTTSLTPEQLKILNGKFIHMAVWTEISVCDALSVYEEEIVCNKSGINKAFEYSLAQGEFFKMNHIIDEIKEAGEEKKRTMCYNPKFIATLHKIFKGEQLNFCFTKGNRGTLVFPVDGGGMFAVLMPVMKDEVVNRYFFT